MEFRNLNQDDVEVLSNLLHESGVYAATKRYFGICGTGSASDATELWLKAYHARQQRDGSGTSALEQWIRQLSQLDGTSIGVAVAAFDGAIEGVSEHSVQAGIQLMLDALSTPWDRLSNQLYVLRPK